MKGCGNEGIGRQGDRKSFKKRLIIKIAESRALFLKEGYSIFYS
jgi:hypothetical protein